MSSLKGVKWCPTIYFREKQQPERNCFCSVWFLTSGPLVLQFCRPGAGEVQHRRVVPTGRVQAHFALCSQKH